MRIPVRIAAGIVISFSSAQAALAASKWMLAGTTYNSVAFVDMASITSSGATKNFTATRVSGQPSKDGWLSVIQKLTVNCDTRYFVDRGSIIEQSDGSTKRYPGLGASQRAMSSGVFYDMFGIVCRDRPGTVVSSPKAWTTQNFKVGQ